MATQYVGGARRSSAPDYSPRAVFGMQAMGGQSPAVPQLLQSFTQSQPSAGSSGLLSPSNAQILGTLGNVSTIASGLGKLTDTPGLSKLGGQVGQGVGAISLVDRLSRVKSPEDVALAVGSSPFALSSMGVGGEFAGPIAGAVSGYQQGGLEGAVVGAAEGYMHYANPVTALIDAALGLTGNDSIFEFASDIAEPVTSAVGDVLSGIGGAAEDIVSGVGGAVSDVGSAIGDIFGW